MVAVKEGSFQRKGAVLKVGVQTMLEHRLLQLQVNRRGKLLSRRPKGHLKLEVILSKKVKRVPKTKPLDQLTSQRVIWLKTAATRVAANQRKLVARERIQKMKANLLMHL
jgi:hypothetical protein